MKAALKAGVLAVTLVVVGCSRTQEAVPVTGTPADLRALTGEWGGDYHGEQTGRSGSIVFKLAAGADTAYGDVVMIAHDRRESRLPSQDPSAGLPIARTPEVVTISFVRAAAGTITGQLAPYKDPECDCMVDTRFEGRLRGDRIEGTFLSRRERGEIVNGTWKVTRKKT
ncbi:MAG TPA: hypothetical protein VJY35_10235 [Candidatus Eisenbacteria bacterium]|nr:hypothetical protein [Candidatus Eisenbacteria bacterium]